MGEGVAGVQQAVRQNAGEVQDYLRDLDNWTKQMEKKDEQQKQAKKKAISEETSKSREASPPKRSKKTEASKEKGDPEKQPVRKSRKMLKRKKMKRRTRRWTMRGRGWKLWRRRREATPPSKLESGTRLLSAILEECSLTLPTVFSLQIERWLC